MARGEMPCQVWWDARGGSVKSGERRAGDNSATECLSVTTTAVRRLAVTSINPRPRPLRNRLQSEYRSGNAADVRETSIDYAKEYTDDDRFRPKLRDPEFYDKKASQDIQYLLHH